jgi:hypothetical protein
MEFLVAALVGALIQAAASLVGRVLLAMFIGYVTYTGLQTGIDALFNQIQQNFSLLPQQAVSLLGFLWVDKAISTLFSAYAAAAGIKMAGSTTLKKMVVK